jgi:hypothetical protein
MAYEESRSIEREMQVLREQSVAKDQCAVRESAGEYNPPRVAASRLTLGNVDTAFTYQPWNSDQIARGEQVREALIAAAKAILRNVPECPQRTRALNNLVDARMIANAAITFDGRF